MKSVEVAAAASSIIGGSAAVPEDLADLAEIVAGLVESSYFAPDAVARIASPADYFRAHSSLDRNSVVTISGARGSGKTTLLAATCMRLIEGGEDIVLPILRPETFRSTDSLASVVLSHVRAMTNSSSSASANEESSEFALALQNALRAAAFSSPGAMQVLLASPTGLSQYAMDAAGLVRQSEELVGSLTSVVEHARQALERPAHARIVVPLDDADLVPKQTGEILAELRLLSAVPGLISVVCVDPDDLQSHLEADIRRDYGSDLDSSHVEHLAMQQIRKTLRPSLLVKPPYITFERRLNFSPIGTTVPLKDLLLEVFLRLDPREEVAQELSDWVSKGDAPASVTRVTGLAWLPETPRGLEEIWTVCSELLVALRASDARASGPWLARLVEVITPSDGGVTPRLDFEEISFRGSALSIRASAAWADFVVGVSSYGGWKTAVDDATLRIRFRSTAGPIASYQTGTADGDSSTEIKPTAVASYLLVQDLLRSSAFEEPRPRWPSDWSGADFFFLQSVRMVDQDTDDFFFTFPISAGAVQTERARRVWNAFVRWSTGPRVRGGNRSRELWCAYAQLVVSSWLDGQAPESVLEGVEAAPLTVLNMLGRKYLAEQGSYSGIVRDSYTPGKGFCHWFEVGLPSTLHDLILPGVDVAELVESWLSFLTLGDRSRDALDELRADMRERIRKNTSSPSRPSDDGAWLCGYLPLLEQVDADSASELQGLLPEYEKRRSRGAVGRAPTESSVEIVTTASGYKFATRPTVAGQAQRELVSAVLAQLRQ